MIELTEEQFECVKPLIPKIEGYLEIKAVIEKNNPGWVFIDSYINPQISIIWNKGNGGFYLLGNNITKYSDKINSLIDIQIKQKLASIGEDYVEISPVPPVSNGDIENIFNYRNIYSWEQSVFQYNKNEKIQLLKNDKLCEIKKIFENNNNIINIDFLKNKILNYWNSIEIFLAKGDGFCIVKDNMIIALAITGWMAGKIHELSIETLEKYRQKGYAKICSSALINHYLGKGYIPYWECEKENTPSLKLAENFGFNKLYDYLCYGFSI